MQPDTQQERGNAAIVTGFQPHGERKTVVIGIPGNTTRSVSEGGGAKTRSYFSIRPQRARVGSPSCRRPMTSGRSN